jgi:hypothetical protein
VTLTASDARATNAYWGRSDLEIAIDAALAGIGKNLEALTIDDLAPVDQFHGGGKASTDRLARVAGFKPGVRADGPVAHRAPRPRGPGVPPPR